MGSGRHLESGDRGDGGGLYSESVASTSPLSSWPRKRLDYHEDVTEDYGLSPSVAETTSSAADYDAIEVPYEELLYNPTKAAANNDDGDLSSSASTEPLGLSYDGGDDYSHSSAGSHSSDSTSSFSFHRRVRILNISDEIGGVLCRHHHDHDEQLLDGCGLEVEFAPDYVSDASDSDDDDEEDEGDGDGDSASLDMSLDASLDLSLDASLENASLDYSLGDDATVGSNSSGASLLGDALYDEDGDEAVAVRASFRDDPEPRIECCVRTTTSCSPADDDDLWSNPFGEDDNDDEIEVEQAKSDKWWESSYGDDLLVPVPVTTQEEEGEDEKEYAC